MGAPESATFDSSAPRRIDGDGSVALVEAAAAAGVKQFVMVTSLGTGKFGLPAGVLNLFWGVLNEKRKAEQVGVKSNAGQGSAWWEDCPSWCAHTCISCCMFHTSSSSSSSDSRKQQAEQHHGVKNDPCVLLSLAYAVSKRIVLSSYISGAWTV